DIRYSLSPRYELELAFSRLSWLNQYVSPSEVKKAIDEAKSLLMQGKSAPGAQSAPRQFISMPQSAPSQAMQQGQAQQNTHNQQASPTNPANPYLNRTITQMPGAETRAQTQTQTASAPRNIFAPPPESAPMQANAPQTTQSLSSDMGSMSEDFAPPDPTPEDAGSQPSFSYGGAVPPQQTAASAQNQGNNSDFRELAIKELSMRDPMLGSSLLQTGAWIKTGNTVTTQVSSGYLKMQLDSHKPKISKFLSDLYNEPLQFEVTLHQIVTTPVEKTAPVQVKLLCDVFKGQIIGHSKKSEQEITAENAERSTEQSEGTSESNEETSEEDEQTD
ncbi:MAG: hypothetical protein J6I53_07575, partial [Treponema sp.]|nr:hypothetical protein [Treponema sp.]